MCKILFENKNSPAMRHAKSVDVGRLLPAPLGLAQSGRLQQTTAAFSVVAAEPISGLCVSFLM